ncbi:unnamed protein product [Heterobilharzia americana]|nr:unnamed protein product [Heterobilharzia americana]CAH8469765.1 unnamed protein product [Heterobilharzia americana]
MTRIRCTFCDMSFVKPSRLEAHLRIHTGERPYTCGCGKAYTRKQHLTRHVPKCVKSVFSEDDLPRQESVGKVKKYSCPQCSAGPFQKKRMVWAHMAIVHRERKHVCDKCDRAFPTISKLKRHSLKHHGYICDLCHEQTPFDHQNTGSNGPSAVRFQNFTSLRRHIAQAHPKPPLQCPTCSMRFTRPSALSEHEATHTPGGPSARRRFICPVCPPNHIGDQNNSVSQGDHIVAFTAKRNLDAHMRSVHGNFKFRCTWRGCPVILSTKQKLNEHLERHRSGKPVAFKSRYKRSSLELNGSVRKNDRKNISSDEDCWETASQNSVVAALLTDHVDCTVE